MISGDDFPLHCQDVIHEFFTRNSGKEFLTISSDEITLRQRALDRVKYYYSVQEVKSKHRIINKLFHGSQNKIFLPLQRMFVKGGVPNGYKVYYGSNWFSISDELARYLVGKKHMIAHIYKNTWCADEIFINTIVMKSDHAKRIYMNGYRYSYSNDKQCNLRYVNWGNPNPNVPQTWTIDDKEELIEAKERGYMFSRKFDEMKDKKIVTYIVKIVSNENISDVKNCSFTL